MFKRIKMFFNTFDKRHWAKEYLNEAKDIYDLEYRMKELDRMGIHWYG